MNATPATTRTIAVTVTIGGETFTREVTEAWPVDEAKFHGLHVSNFGGQVMEDIARELDDHFPA